MKKLSRMARWGVGAGLAVAAALAVLAIALKPAKTEAACCYFAAQEKDINQPGQKAFITWDPDQKLESWTVQPKFEGNAVDFGMVIPSPGQPKLDEMPRDFFKDLAIYTILLPLPQGIHADLNDHPKRDGGRWKSGAGGALPPPMDRNEMEKGVTVLEAGVVGSLDYKVIKATDANGLFDWLKENKYVYSGDQGTLDFYIQKKWFFTVMKIDPKQMKKSADGSYVGEVTPTRFSFSSDACVYPLRITALSVKDQTDALLYVQSPKQMDLPGDLSWMHSYRVMYLTYMLGCSANAEEQQELNERNAWMGAKKKGDPKYDTTKLEWSKLLGDGEISVLEDPLKNFAQMGGGALAPGDEFVSQETFLKEVWDAYDKPADSRNDEYAKARLKELEAQYTSAKGAIVRAGKVNPWFGSTWMWYPHREAPAEELKGLTILKGHLQKGQWLTKIRKILRKDEMTDDLLLTPVPAGKEQEYVRIMPTSPP